MKSIGWIALTVVALVMAGCAKTEPSKSTDGKKKAVATEQKAASTEQKATQEAPAAEAKPAAPVAKEPAATTEMAEPKTKLAEPAPADQPPAAVKKEEGKGGNVPGAMGKALLKAVGGAAKGSDPKASDEAPKP